MTPQQIIAAALSELKVAYVTDTTAHESMMRQGLSKFQEKAAPWRKVRVKEDPTPLEIEITLPFPSGCRRLYAVTDQRGYFIAAFEDLAAKTVVIERDEAPVFPLSMIYFLDTENLPMTDELPPEVPAGVLYDWMVASLEIKNEGRTADIGKALNIEFDFEDHATTTDRRKEVEIAMAECVSILPMITVCT